MESEVSAPVALFAFRRPSHLQETLEALAQNARAKATDVYAFVDAARDRADRELVDDVCETLDEFAQAGHFRSLKVFRAESPKGLARSVIDGLTMVLSEHDRVIGLEDDIVLAPSGLAFLNAALDAYESDRRVWSVSAFAPTLVLPDDFEDDVFFSRRASSWGYATWKDRWDLMSWNNEAYQTLADDRRFRRRFALGGNDLPPMLDKQLAGKIDSWAVRWCARQAELGSLTVYPARSLVRNSGLDGSGTHSPAQDGACAPLGSWDPQENRFSAPRTTRATSRLFRKQFVSRRRLLASKVWQMRPKPRSPRDT